MEKETWKNVTAGSVWIRRRDPLSGRRKDEIIRGGATFMIEPEVRRQQQVEAWSEDQDVFNNGTLVLIDGNEELAEDLRSNPNAKTDDELKAMFDMHWQSFDKELAGITNLTTLRRLQSIATAAEDVDGDEEPEVEVTLRQVREIEKRIDELNPVNRREVVGSVDV